MANEQDVQNDARNAMQTNVAIASFCAVTVFVQGFDNWFAAFVVTLVCMGGPAKYTFHVIRWGEDGKLFTRAIKIFYVWLTGIIPWFYLFGKPGIFGPGFWPFSD